MLLKILVLQDNRIANYRQAMSLALGIKDIFKDDTRYVVRINTVKLHSNALSKLPNMLRLGSVIAKFTNPDDQNYDIIISCGRNLAAVAAKAKRKYGHKKTALVSILNPDLPFRLFNVVLLPKHDERRHKNQKNIVYTNGALTYFEESYLKSCASSCREIISHFHKPYILFAIGGDSKHFTLTKENGENMINILNNIASKMNATLLITTSRRTPEHILQTLREKLTCSYYLYTYNKDRAKDFNPYIGFLVHADYFIVTADSISMISEMSHFKKPLYVYENGIQGDKYKTFMQLAVNLGVARKLDENVTTLENFKSVALDDPAKVAVEVMEKVTLLK